MATLVGVTTFSTTAGLNTISIGFQAAKIKATVGGKTGGDTYFHKSEGAATATTQRVITSNSTSTSAPKSGLIISHVNAAGTVVFEASLDSISATSITFNVTTASAPTVAYPVLLEVDS